MEKRGIRKIRKVNGNTKEWRAKEVIKDLLSSGAVEIPADEWEKEPYKTLMKNIKKNDKFICD